jgi:hypothetical protein
MLAHASGEWIASDWPVCPIAEMGSPRRMGAALTYARRYALFTLVGIAGEDDLDAPDLHDAKASSLGPGNNVGNMGLGAPAAVSSPRSSGNGRGRAVYKPIVVDLAPDQSAGLRDRLLGELREITETDNAATWARNALRAKNSLRATDAKLVEDAFEKRLAELQRGDQCEEATASPAAMTPSDPTPSGATSEGAAGDEPKGIDKSVLSVSEPRRYRNKEHLRFVAGKACLVCGRKPSDPHHLRFVQPRALGRKASDEFAVPLCRIHHRLVHRVGNEAAWWRDAGIDPLKAARKLWKHTRQIEDRSESKNANTVAPVTDRSSESKDVATARSDKTLLDHALLATPELPLLKIGERR